VLVVIFLCLWQTMEKRPQGKTKTEEAGVRENAKISKSSPSDRDKIVSAAEQVEI